MDLILDKLRAPLACIVACTLVVLPLGCRERAVSLVLRGEAMGTTWQVSVGQLPSDIEQAALRAGIEAQIEQIEAQMSHWRDDSVVGRFNRAAANEPVEIPLETAQVIDEALRLCRETDGAFDVTTGALVNLWGFGPSGPRHAPPTDEQVETARRYVGSEQIELDRSNPRAPQLRKRVAQLQLDLSALAKGYAIDHVARFLDASGVEHYLVELGGELKARGFNDRKTPWRVGLEQPDPNSVGRVRRVVALRNEAVATSGNYRLFYRGAEDDRLFSHILDPHTGRPVQHGLVSVSVIGDSAMHADALATALMVLGPEHGYQFAVDNAVAAVLVIEADGRLVENETPLFAARRRTP